METNTSTETTPMKFRSYEDARKFFQQSKSWLTLDRFKEMVKALELMFHDYNYLIQKAQITDLIIDIEHYIDLLSNPDLLMHERRKEHKVETPVSYMAPHILDLPEASPSKIASEMTNQPFFLELLDLEEMTDLKFQVERELFAQVLRHTKNSRVKAAEILGISARGLRCKLTSLNLIKKGQNQFLNV